MFSYTRRFAAGVSSRAGILLRFALVFFFLFAALSAEAVVVRGRVVDPLGAVVPFARIQLVEGGRVAATAIAGSDGTFDIRTSDAGRFTLLTSAGGFLPAVGVDFYGGATEVVAQDVVMSRTTVRQEVSVTATGVPTPLPQLTVPLTVIPGDDLATRIGIVQEMRQVPGAFVVQTGQTGGITSLFLRGGQSDANKVLIDGVPAEDVGGRFDFGTVSSTGVGSLEVLRGPDAALYGSDALASVVSITTPRGSALRPQLDYSGDGGNLYTYRNEVAVSGARRQLDYFGTFSRFDTSNALRLDKYHSATAAANLGYAVNARTQARGTIRNAVSAGGVPNAHDFFGISANAKQADQDIYAQGTLENRAGNEGDWHNLVRYGVARKREQFTTFSPVGNAVTSFGFNTYYGNVVTIRGANGYTAKGQASIAFGGTYPQAYLLVSNRDELYYQSDYAISRHTTVLFGFRYENERGAYRYPVFGTNQSLQRTNFTYSGLLQGDIRNRIFYSLGGAVEKNHLYGTRGTPRLGLSWAAVRPSNALFHGTKLRFNVSRGVQEPNLSVQFSSLYGTLLGLNNTAAIAAYGIRPIQAQEGRTYDVGVDQNITSKLIVKGSYFHSQYDHEIEYVNCNALKLYFAIPCVTSSTGPAGSIPNVFGAYLNSLTYRAQGAEFEAQYRPANRIFLSGGYTFLAPIVQRSFSSDALRVAGSTVNPAFPGITIGSTSPLVGQRPFRRAPNTGFLSAQYTRTKYTVALRGAFAGKSDDSTFLGGSTPSFDNSLLLPNRDLDFGYAKLDLSATYAATSHVKVFTQLENLTNNQHIGPIGYPGLPLTVRAGVKVRIGGD